MYTEFHKAAILSCRVLLRPIVKLFLRYGLSYREFAAVAKFAYLDVATEGGTASPNISLIAVRTGISRKAIRKLLKSRNEERIVLKSDGLYDFRVLELWRESERYCDSSGNPMSLHYSGEHSVTLSDLLTELGADVPPSTILKRMLATDMIDIDSEGKYFPRIHDPTPSISGPDNLLRASTFVAAHVDTISNNISDEPENRLLERQTYSLKVPKHSHGEALDRIRSTCNTALSEIERIISSYEIDGETDSVDMIGIGMYSFNFELPVDDLSGVFEWLNR